MKLRVTIRRDGLMDECREIGETFWLTRKLQKNCLAVLAPDDGGDSDIAGSDGEVWNLSVERKSYRIQRLRLGAEKSWIKFDDIRGFIDGRSLSLPLNSEVEITFKKLPDPCLEGPVTSIHLKVVND